MALEGVLHCRRLSADRPNAVVAVRLAMCCRTPGSVRVHGTSRLEHQPCPARGQTQRRHRLQRAVCDLSPWTCALRVAARAGNTVEGNVSSHPGKNRGNRNGHHVGDARGKKVSFFWVSYHGGAVSIKLANRRDKDKTRGCAGAGRGRTAVECWREISDRRDFRCDNARSIANGLEQRRPTVKVWVGIAVTARTGQYRRCIRHRAREGLSTDAIQPGHSGAGTDVGKPRYTAAYVQLNAGANDMPRRRHDRLRLRPCGDFQVADRRRQTSH